MNTQVVVLSIDPGITTGYAVLEKHHGEILDVGSFSPAQVKGGFTRLRKNFSIEAVVREFIFADYRRDRLSAQALTRLTVDLDVLFPEAVIIQPSQWKSSPARFFETPKWEGRVFSQHESDAIRLGLWFIKYLGGAVNVHSISD